MTTRKLTLTLEEYTVTLQQGADKLSRTFPEGNNAAQLFSVLENEIKKQLTCGMG